MFFPHCVVLIPCLFHLLLVLSVSWYSFSWCSCINLLFGSRKKNGRFVVGQKLQKNIIDYSLTLGCWTKVAKKKKKLFEKYNCFSWFLNHFCCGFVFSCMIFKNMLPLFFFQRLWKISCFFCLNLFLSVQKKSPQKTFLILFILCLLSLVLLFLFSTLFFCFLFYLTMFLSLCLLSLCLLTLSLSLLCFFLSLSLSYALLFNSFSCLTHSLTFRVFEKSFFFISSSLFL